MRLGLPRRDGGGGAGGGTQQPAIARRAGKKGKGPKDTVITAQVSQPAERGNGAGSSRGGTATEAIDTATARILPVVEPYASAIVAGEKTWELRPDAHVQPGRIYISVAARRRDKERAGDGAEVLVPKGDETL